MAEGAVFKINALWLYSQNFKGFELDTIKTEMEKITGIYASNVLVFDLATVAKVIEDMDGITVNVTEAIYDPQFPTPDGGYEIFSLPSGRRYLDAATALKFVRTRASAGGDFDRIDRQQELLRALKGKITSLSPIWNFPTLWSIFITVKKEVVTDLTLEDFKNLWSISQGVGLDDIDVLSLDTKTELVLPKQTSLGGQTAYTLIPKEGFGQYDQIREFIKEFIRE